MTNFVLKHNFQDANCIETKNQYNICIETQNQDTKCIETKIKTNTNAQNHWNNKFKTKMHWTQNSRHNLHWNKYFKTKLALETNNQDNNCTWNIFKYSKSPILFRERSCHLHTSWQHRRRYLHTSWQHMRHTYVVAAQAPLEKGRSFKDVLWILGRSYGHTDPF